MANDDLPTLTMAEFLTSVPPGRAVTVSDLAKQLPGNASSPIPYLNTPDVQLECPECDGVRWFMAMDKTQRFISTTDRSDVFTSYTCRNCGTANRTFSVAVQLSRPRGTEGVAIKFGEIPQFGKRTPSRVVELIGPDRDLFFKGRRCENQGLGIGAFIYYRRAVENQKNRLIDHLAKAARKLGASTDLLDEMERAKRETQFTSAVDVIKHALPPGLLIKGQNPLKLLHSALSEHVHARTDDECLELAAAVREVLFAFADRLSEALSEQQALDAAVSKLMQAKSPKST